MAEMVAELRPKTCGGKNRAATNQYTNPSPEVMADVPTNELVFSNMMLFVFIH
ncbi:MAG: hypothetical protein NVS4B11_03660 [Ktedonobacteraceae bacterium]